MLDTLVSCTAYGLLAAAVLAAAHRFLRPVSRESALILGLLPLLITGRALLTGRVLAPVDLQFATEPFAAVAVDQGVAEVRSGPLTDLNGQSLPWRAAIRHALRHRQWPLYNPFILCGQPLAGTAQPAPYEPLRLMALLVPLHTEPAFLASGLLLLAAVGAFLFARDLGCVEPAALVAAIGWMLCDFVLFYLLYAMGATVVLLPLVLLATRRVTRHPGPAAAAALTLILLDVLLAGHPESALHVVSAGALFGGWELCRLPDWRTRARAAAVAVAAGLLALAISAVFLLPVLTTLPQTWQFHFRHRALASASHTLPAAAVAARLAHGVVPFQWGFAGDETVPPRRRGPHALPWQSWHAGSLLLAPALLGLLLHPARERWFFAAVGAGAALVAAGAPGFADTVATLPLYDTTLNSRLFFVAAFAVVILAALGVDLWWRGLPDRVVSRILLASGVAVAVVVVVDLPTMAAQGLSDEFVWRRGGLLLVPLVAAALMTRGRRRSQTAVAAFLVLLAAQRVAESGVIYPTLAPAAFYPRVAPLDALPAPIEPYRVVGLGKMLIPNVGAVLGFDDPRGDDAVTFGPYGGLERLWSAKHRWFRRVVDLERPLLDVLNVRFAVVPRDLQPPAGWRRVANGPGADLLENIEALPRAFVPTAVRFSDGPQLELRQMAAEPDLRHIAWIRQPAAGAARETIPNGPGRVTTRREGTRYVLEATMEAAGWVVMSEAAWPGWRATTAGRSLPLTIADHALLAFHLPPGRHRIRLEYRPRAFDLGLGITLGTLLLAVPAWCRWAAATRDTALR